MTFTGPQASWQRLLSAIRRAVRAFEAERTDDHSTWKLRVRLERDDLDGGWIAECLDMPGCISEGATQEEALQNIADAISEVVAVRIGSHIPTLAPDDEARSGFELSLSV